MMGCKPHSLDPSELHAAFSWQEAESTENRPLNQLQALYEMGQTVTSSLNLDTVLQSVLTQIVSVVRATGASILVPEADSLIFAAACGQGAETLINQCVPLEGSVAGMVFHTGKAVVISDAVTSKRVYRASEQLTGQQVGSLLAVPLRIEDQFLGVMEAVHTQQHKFGDDDLQLFETAASWASMAISNARQHADVKRQLLERNEMELARRAAEATSRAKSEFLANMSHEIRTPMNAIIGFNHLALKSEKDPKQVSYLTKIQTSAYALLEILEDILNYSKLETGRLEIEETPFDLDKVLINIFTLSEAKANEKGLELHLRMEPNLPAKLIGDPLRLKDILINLLDNAVKFTDRGEIQISVDTVCYQDQIVTVRFIVSDSGIGMDDRQMASLFQPFVQADSSTTRKYGGTGLGLAICKRLLDLMGGSIQVKSKLSVGSSFIITIPLFLQPETSKRQIMPAILGKLRVLVADDDMVSRMLFENMLRGMKFAVSVVDTGVSAIVELERASEAGEQPYDLLILDWKAAGMDNLEIVKNIKTDQCLPQPPAIILTTTYGSQELFHVAENSPIDGFLVKPVNSSLLLDTIQDIFWQRHSQGDETAQLSLYEARHNYDLAGTFVLLVDDNEINRIVARNIMQQAGIFVTEAGNGQEAVEIVTENQLAFNAILMDMAMPVMNGYEAAQRIRSSPAGKDIPIIAMTANNTVEDRDKSREAGIDDYIPKPVSPQELLTILDAWVPTDSDRKVGFELEPLFTELRALLKQHDTEAVLVLDIIRGQAQLCKLQKQLEKLQRLVQSYDFDGAVRFLDRLLAMEKQSHEKAITSADDSDSR
jgi:signal transduction histidine kinase/CheY-like chemotaxis protein